MAKPRQALSLPEPATQSTIPSYGTHEDDDNDVGQSKDNRRQRRPYPRGDVGPAKEHA